MKKILLLFFCFLITSCLFANPLKIAQVYSMMDNYQWKNTFDPYVGDSILDKYEATEFNTLAQKLQDYDIVLLGVCANYYGQIDFNSNKEYIDNYLKSGGIIFVTDANYGSAENWIHDFYPETLYQAGGESDGESGSILFAQHHPIISDLIGGDIPPLAWGRVKNADGYKVLYVSGNQRPHMVYKEIGKGIVIVSPSGLGWNMFKFLKNTYNYVHNPVRLANIENPVTEPTLNINKATGQSLNFVYGKEGVKTDWSVTSDKTGFRFKFTCYDNNIKDIVINQKNRDDKVFLDDCVEVFITPNTGDGNVYHFVVNPNNVQYDEKNMDPTFDTYFESKTNINKDKWTCEIYIPYSSLDLNCNSNLDKKTPFTFNVGRCYHPLKEDYGLYSYANCPDLILYDKEFFAKCEGNIDLSLFTYTDKLKINTPDKYYVGKNEFTTNSGYDFSLIDIKSGKVYDSVNKKIELNLDREPLKLYAIIKKDNVVLASSSVINVETEKFLSYDIVYPFYKSIVQSKDPNKTFKGSVIIDRNDFDLYDIIYSVKLGSKTIKSDTVSVRPNEKQEIAFGLGDLKPGEYVCEFVVKGKGQIIDKCEYPFEVCAPADFEVTFDDRNLCYVNGEPFFPIGLYHANGREIAQRNPDKQMLSEEEAIIDIKDKNFNFGASLNYIKPEDYPVYTKNGLLYCPEIGRTTDKSVIDPIIKAVNDQKTSLIYYTYDEPYGNLVNEATEAYDYINKQDKHRPIVAAVNTPEVFWYTNNTFDIFMPDVYIFTQNNKPSVTGLKGAIDTAKAASHNQKPIWMVPQAFGWGDPEMVWRVPTTEELRCQAYFSLVQGVTGLFWYAYVTGEADKTSPYGIWYIRNSDIWDYFKILNKEILDFSEILYKGKSLGSLKCDNELIFSNVWQVGDTKYAIIVNPEQSEQTATFEALPDNVTPVFDYIYNIEGKTIHFKPLECVIVRY